MPGILSINLSAIQHNWRYIAKQVVAGAEAGAVVKANAYGLGVQPVAQALFAAGCRTFFVAHFAEAQALKSTLASDCRIFILTGVRESEIAACVEANFIPVLVSAEQCRQWAAGCNRLGTQAFSAIKVDTGMHRLGLCDDELSTLLADEQLLLSCSPILLMSHLACAELPDHPLNRQQLNSFQKAIAQVRKKIPNIAISFANSSGIFLGSEYHFNLVRPGVSLYGVNPTPHLANPMQAVVNLRLPVLQIKTVRGPAAVGYDALYSIPAGEQRRLAIVAGGYADGLFVKLTNAGVGLLAGQEVPMVGRTSMDTTIFDISAIDDAIIAGRQNHFINVLDAEHCVDQLAREADTIGYEILTSLGQRYQREYFTNEITGSD